jgi:hypothetical protein
MARLANPFVSYGSKHPPPVPFLSFNFVNFVRVFKPGGGGGVCIFLPHEPVRVLLRKDRTNYFNVLFVFSVS